MEGILVGVPDSKGSISADAKMGGKEACETVQGQGADMKYCTVKVVAVFLGIHEDTLRGWIKRGVVKAYQPTGVRGKILIPWPQAPE